MEGSIHCVMNGDVVTITTTESAKCKNLVHYNHNYHKIMQEMFKSERSKVKFAQILVRPWPDLKACSYTSGMAITT